MSDAAPRFGVYVHWPYCSRICPYCDFNVYRARGRDAEPLLSAIAADLAGWRARIGPRRAETVFLGGGTPSLLSGAGVARLLRAVDTAFPLAPDCEVTLEANPEDAARFGDHVAAGVTRLSLGVQALRDADLVKLGRAHDAATARAAVAAAARTGARVSVDLIYAREGQGVADWEAELGEALSWPAEHFSLYQLSIEAGTAFERAVRRGRLAPLDAERAAALYEATQALCEAEGASAYEISNHARGMTARSRHNLLYWTFGEWVGVGPGAHGRATIDGRRWSLAAHRRPEAYADAVAREGWGVGEAAPLSAIEAADEMLVMGLRIAEGLERAPYERLRGRPLDSARVAALTEAGLLADDPARLRLTTSGRLVADRLAAELAAASA